MQAIVVPKITQPGKTNYKKWLEINDEILYVLVKSFMEQIEYEYGVNYNRGLLLNRFLSFIYKHSSTRRATVQRQVLLLPS